MAHAYHPWNLPFTLLIVAALAVMRVSHIEEKSKATLTIHSNSTTGREAPRTLVQVLANTSQATMIIALHAYCLQQRTTAVGGLNKPIPESSACPPWRGDLLIIGFIASYASAIADTFSSELGILSKDEPRLITSLALRKVPRGTNGGVTLLGLRAALLGSSVVVTAAMLLLPISTITGDTPEKGLPWTSTQRWTVTGFLIIWGVLGSVLDSILGGLFQRSIKDVRSGKIVEADGSRRAPLSATTAAASGIKDQVSATTAESAVEHQDQNRLSNLTEGYDIPNSNAQRTTIVESGWDLLDNNEVNFITVTMMGFGAIAVVAWFWNIPMNQALNCYC
ncbi:DUF92 domain protein, partial [Metarhizium majus ARSEF 297]